MLRKLVILGVCAGSSASIPIVYQSNPDTFVSLYERVVGSGTQQAPEAAPQPNITVARATREPETLVGRKVRLAADDRGHFTAEFKLNGRRVAAMIDTGATLVAINVSTARRIGIQLAPEDFKYKVDTANGEARAATVVIDQLQIGKIFVANVEAVVLDDSALNSTLMGMSFLKRLGRYEVENGALLLAQ